MVCAWNLRSSGCEYSFLHSSHMGNFSSVVLARSKGNFSAIENLGPQLVQLVKKYWYRRFLGSNNSFLQFLHGAISGGMEKFDVFELWWRRPGGASVRGRGGSEFLIINSSNFSSSIFSILIWSIFARGGIFSSIFDIWVLSLVTISTPAPVFFTYPFNLDFLASRRINGRNPTPWTIPVMRNLCQVTKRE